MKCVCLVKCFVSFHGRNTRFNPGRVVEFEECPKHFKPLDEKIEVEGINFDDMSEDELIEAEYPLDDLKAFIMGKYGLDSGRKGKRKTVSMLLDCRYREVI